MGFSYRGIYESKNFSGTDLMSCFIWQLCLIWLKFLCLWRYFRFFSLLDGINTVDNMQLCMWAQPSIIGFWKGWHCSFNQWSIRYIYIPLGGSRNGILRRVGITVLIFMFIAFWHELEIRLLYWGLGMAVFVIPEILCGTIFQQPKYNEFHR
eukprot:UN04535